MPECPLCEGTADPWLTVPTDWRRPGHGPWRLYWCNECRYGFLWPRPALDEIADFYKLEHYYTHGTEVENAAGRRNIINRALVRLAWHYDYGIDLLDSQFITTLSPGKRVCDLGCGDGRKVLRLLAAGHDVIGVDPDERAREVALSQGAVVLTGTAEHLPDEIPHGSFDLVIMHHSLEHCLDPIAALTNAKKLLRIDGRLLVEVPNNEARGLRQAAIFWPWLDAPRHLQFFTESSLAAIYRKVELVPTATGWTGYTRQFLPNWRAAEEQIRRVFEAKSRSSDRWRLLARTIWSIPNHKYDSVQMLGTKIQHN